MKTLLLSLLLTVLAITLVGRRHAAHPATRVVDAPRRTLPSQTGSETPGAPSATQPDSTPSTSMPPAGGGTHPPHATPWDAFRAGDLPAFVRLLRSSGCPEPSVRLLALAAVGRPIQQRLEESLRAEIRTSRWWQASPLTAHRNLSRTLQQARRELDAAMDALTGESAASLRTDLAGQPLEPAPWLDADHRAPLMSLQSRHAADLADLADRGFPGITGPSLTPELRSELRSLRQRQDEEIRSVLGPDAYAEYLVRESPAADFVRRALPEARDEAEFRRMVQAALDTEADPLDTSAAFPLSGIPAGALPRDTPNTREQVLARLRELSSPEETAAFEGERAAEEQRKAREEQARREASTLGDLQDLARSGGIEVNPEEAGRLLAALERRSGELDAELGKQPPPGPGTEAHRALVDRIAREFEALATGVLGDPARAHALTEALRRRQDAPR